MTPDLTPIRAALETHQCERCKDCRYGAGVIEDDLNNAMGGVPWRTCPACCGDGEKIEKALELLAQLEQQLCRSDLRDKQSCPSETADSEAQAQLEQPPQKRGYLCEKHQRGSSIEDAECSECYREKLEQPQARGDVPDTPDYAAMQAGDFLAAVGMDANKWADAFEQIKPPTDHGTMLGWFANAIMAGYGEAMRRTAPPASEPQAWGDERIHLDPEVLSEICQIIRAKGLSTLEYVAATAIREYLRRTAPPETVARGDEAFPLGAIENGRAFISRLENEYDFEMEAGPLRMCRDWIELQRCFEYVAEYLLSSRTAPPAPVAEVRGYSTWHEDHGDVLWFSYPIRQPPYCGTPLDSSWPFEHDEEGDLYWTPIVDGNLVHSQIAALRERGYQVVRAGE